MPIMLLSLRKSATKLVHQAEYQRRLNLEPAWLRLPSAGLQRSLLHSSAFSPLRVLSAYRLHDGAYWFGVWHRVSGTCGYELGHWRSWRFQSAGLSVRGETPPSSNYSPEGDEPIKSRQRPPRFLAFSGQTRLSCEERLYRGGASRTDVLRSLDKEMSCILNNRLQPRYTPFDIRVRQA